MAKSLEVRIKSVNFRISFLNDALVNTIQVERLSYEVLMEKSEVEEMGIKNAPAEVIFFNILMNHDFRSRA